MTTPGGIQQYGGSAPPFESLGQQVLATARARMDPRSPQVPVLTPQERAEAEQAAAEQRNCLYCGGLHAGPSTPACPRLASFDLDGDGRVKSGTFWPGLEWAKGRVVLAEDVHEEGAEEEAGDGGH